MWCGVRLSIKRERAAVCVRVLMVAGEMFPSRDDCCLIASQCLSTWFGWGYIVAEHGWWWDGPTAAQRNRTLSLRAKH